jgi:hypothetical protein
MSPRNKLTILLAGAALVIGIPVLAQDRPESILPPGFGDPATAPPPARPAPDPAQPRPAPGPIEGSGVVEATAAQVEAEAAAALPQPVQQIELPSGSRRDASLAGPLPPEAAGFGAAMWGGSSGKMLSVAMRRTQAPLASRWGHILLRNALLAGAAAPGGAHPADWTAERAWLLLRMGEADAARMLVASVDVADFTPKLHQVATQVALASSDPAALCPIKAGIGRSEKKIVPLIDAMCASLSGNSEVAASDIETSRRRGRFEQIDLTLAAKVVGAGADTSRASTIEWEPVEQLTLWRFGLATATGIVVPERLMENAPLRLWAWQARAPMLSATDRVKGARVAAGLGVFSSQSLIDLYSQIFDATDPDTLAQTDAWQLRQAMVGDDRAARVAAIRNLLDKGNTPIEREANRALVARAASLIAPDSALEDIAPDLLAAMISSGDTAAMTRWVPVIGDMSAAQRAKCWAIVALALPNVAGDEGQIDNYIDEDTSDGQMKSGLLVAGLAGLGKIDGEVGSDYSRQLELGLARKTAWTDLIDGASMRRQSGTVALLSAMGLQSRDNRSISPLHLYHLVTALRRNGLEFHARMIAAEAVARS